MRIGWRWVAGGSATLVAWAAVVGAVHTASARDDSGVHEFFSTGAGSAEEAAPAPRAEPVQMAPLSRPVERSVHRSPKDLVRTTIVARERPLTVRLHAAKAVKSAVKTNQFALAPTRPGKVSIFYDKTLQPGDAVMSFKGIRIFAGSKSWPYHDSDFVALADAKQLDKGMRQVLLDLDRLPSR